MNMKQLETFHWVERLGSFSAVAERMHAFGEALAARLARVNV